MAPRASAPLFVQVLALLLLSVVGAQLISMAIIFTLPPPTPEIFRMADVAQALHTGAPSARLRVDVAAAPPAGRRWSERRAGGPVINAVATRELGRLLGVPADRVRVVDRRPTPMFEPIMRFDRRWPSHRILTSADGRASVQAGFGDARGGAGAGAGGANALRPDNWVLFGQFQAAVRAADGRWLTVQPRDNPFPSVWQQRVLVWLAACALLFAPIAYLFARRLAAPISAFASAAERLGRNPRAQALAVAGPAEVRVAMGAFNQMQERLRRYVDDRTAMIGAVAHDLRTPLTRMRFMLEARPEEVREKMEREIDEMDAMISATLAFVKDASADRERVLLDVGALVESLVGDMSDTAAGLACDPCPQILMRGDPIALRRLFSNLLTNAVKFAGGADVSMKVDGDDAVATIDDRGPGIAESELDQVFEPFFRAEGSRNRETGGIGLGLAVVRSVARAHGGEATLFNRSGGGLRCVVRLPMERAAA